MEQKLLISDFNPPGQWAVLEVQCRYITIRRELGLPYADPPVPRIHRGDGRQWVYPIVDSIIVGVKKHDGACIELGVQYIVDDPRVIFAKIHNSKLAKTLRNAPLTSGQKWRLGQKIVSFFEFPFPPREFRQYLRLLRRIGFEEFRTKVEAHLTSSSNYHRACAEFVIHGHRRTEYGSVSDVIVPGKKWRY